MPEYTIRQEHGMLRPQHYIYIRRWWWPFWVKADCWPYDTLEDAKDGAERHASGGTYLGKFHI